MSANQRIVVVTGASAGLGRAIALAFGREGASVASLARGERGLDGVGADLANLGVGHLELAVDVAEWDEVSAAAERIEKDLGPIDVWVNNAMTSVFAPFSETAIEDFRRATEVDYLGFVHGTKAALEHMTPRDRGAVVQVSSALAYRSIPLQAAYCGSKHAIVGFTESLLTELRHAKSKVHVTMVHMPAMNTPQFDWVRSTLPNRARPVAPVYQPEVGAKAVVYAARHPRRRGYYVGMSTVLTVYGNRVMPGLLDRYLARVGFQAQQDKQPDSASRPDDLDEPVDRDPGAHGRFDDESHSRSWQWWISTHRGLSALGTAAAAGLPVLLRRWGRDTQRRGSIGDAVGSSLARLSTAARRETGSLSRRLRRGG